MDVQRASHLPILICGAGFSGIGAAVRLKQAGFHEFAVLERADDVGGTWRDNTYPGCACDVQSNLYSFSFAPHPGWSRTFSPQREIQDYLRAVVREHGVLEHVRFSCTLRSARWDEQGRMWRVDTTRGELTCDVLIAGMGPFSEPFMPDLPGLASFAGPAFHSARWNHGCELAGKRVAVIGTGASAVQFVPEIQKQVHKLTLFQRTPAWVLPRADRATSRLRQRLVAAVPAAQRAARTARYVQRELTALLFQHPAAMRQAERLARAYLEREVRDPVLRHKLTPRFAMGCKRVLLSSDYYRALTQPNVEVVTQAVREVRSHAIVGADGREHAVDAIIFGTGFHVSDMPFAEHVRGRDGRTLHEAWQGSPKAHVGTTVAGFPNLFLLLGPNTGLGHSSVVLMIESQLRLVLGALQHMRAHGYRTLEPHPAVQQRYVAELARKSARTVWTEGGCRSWYIDQTGRNSTLWPGFTFAFAWRALFREGEYLLGR